jgi:uncharacterized protein (TIGR04222 family)
MTIDTAPSTWGVTAPQFLRLYGGLCALSGLWAWIRWRGAMRPRPSGGTPRPLDLYDLALLGGGPQLAITTAATRLHRDGILCVGWMQTLEVHGEPDPVHPLERDVLRAVRRDPGLWVSELRAEVGGGDAIRSMTSDLTDAGALLDGTAAARLRRLWLVGLALAALGAIRIAAGVADRAPVGVLSVVVGAVALATCALARMRPVATARGRALVERRRREHQDLRHAAPGGDSALIVALFGGGALWVCAPELAGALGVPRDQARRGGSCPACGAGEGCASGP